MLTTQLAAKQNGYADVVYLDAKTDTYLEEVSSCNIFTVKGKHIKTPPLQVSRHSPCFSNNACYVSASMSAMLQHQWLPAHLDSFAGKPISIILVLHACMHWWCHSGVLWCHSGVLLPFRCVMVPFRCIIIMPLCVLLSCHYVYYYHAIRCICHSGVLWCHSGVLLSSVLQPSFTQ